MERLPVPVITKILSYLSLKERARFRRVCKQFSEFDLRSQDCLCIHRDSYPWNLTWTLTSKSEGGQLVGHHNSTDFLNKKFYKLTFNPLMQIRKLYITSVCPLNVLEISLNTLNYFKSLIQLEIFEGQFDENVSWSFKKLKVLSLNNCTFRGVVELDCPSLESFVCWTAIRNLKLNYPSTLKYLELFQFDSSIRRFKRVESLAFLCFSSIDLEICARELTKLRELHLNMASYQHLDLEDFNQLIADLKSRALKVNLTWFRLSPCMYSKRVVIDEGNAAIALNNYKSLENNLRYRFEVNYSALLKAFDSSIPQDFSEKFIISHVEINEQADEALFVRFLADCKQLRCVRVNELFIKQFSYGHLSLLPSLEELEISKSDLSISDHHQFLGDLKNLKSLKLTLFGHHIEFPLLFDFIWNSILRCNSLRDLFILKNNRFANKFIWIKIPQSQDDHFLVYSDAQIQHWLESLDKMLVHLLQEELPAFLNNK